MKNSKGNDFIPNIAFHVEEYNLHTIGARLVSHMEYTIPERLGIGKSEIEDIKMRAIHETARQLAEQLIEKCLIEIRGPVGGSNRFSVHSELLVLTSAEYYELLKKTCNAFPGGVIRTPR